MKPLADCAAKRDMSGKLDGGCVSAMSPSDLACLPPEELDKALLSLIILYQSTSAGGAIDNKIEQAMDLVKSHLLFAVREEVEVLKVQIKELGEKNDALLRENQMLRQSNPQQQPAPQAYATTAQGQQTLPPAQGQTLPPPQGQTQQLQGTAMSMPPPQQQQHQQQGMPPPIAAQHPPQGSQQQAVPQPLPMSIPPQQPTQKGGIPQPTAAQLPQATAATQQMPMQQQQQQQPPPQTHSIPGTQQAGALPPPSQQSQQPPVQHSSQQQQQQHPSKT